MQHRRLNGYNFEQLVREAISQSRIYCYYSPVKLTRDLMLYPFGLVSLKALKLIDGIFDNHQMRVCIFSIVPKRGPYIC